MDRTCRIMLFTAMWLVFTTVPTARGQNPDPQPKTAQPLESKTASAPWVTPAVRANRVERRTFESAAAKTKVDRKSTRLNSSHVSESRMPSSA